MNTTIIAAATRIASRMHLPNRFPLAPIKTPRSPGHHQQERLSHTHSRKDLASAGKADHRQEPPAVRGPAFPYFSQRDAKFLFTATKPEQYKRLSNPEFTFAGRSNVGKSSLISAVLRSQSLVKTSKKPGHTSTLNFFGLTSSTYPESAITVVDMPGYGFRSRDDWGQFIMEYLSTRKELKRVFLLVEAKVGELKTTDLSFLELVEQYNVPTQLLLTKTDKLKRTDLNIVSGKVLRAAMDVAPTAVVPEVICCSYKTKVGVDAIQEAILRASGVAI
ncbi:hypothetical protein GGF37_001521 [Kickxella alabastrina]|nr:hypothetical protein GGF37_001521 [Kickxella alabastrina]